MLRLCQAVPAALLLPACFLSHTPEDDAPLGDAGRRDAGAEPDAAWPHPTPVRPDAGVCELPSGLPFAHTATSSCTSGPSAISVRLEGCFCEPRARCSARVDEPPGIDGLRVVWIETELCENPDIDCDGCVPFVDVECELPPLEPRAWQVYVNGRYAFRMPEPVEDPIVTARCWAFAEPVVPAATDELFCSAPGADQALASACFTERVAANRSAELRVTSACTTCPNVASDCEVTLSGGTLSVVARDLECSCPACRCSRACGLLERRCRTPALPEGTYEVAIDGLPAGEIVSTHEAFSGFGVCLHAP
jgi:hypothetical protein